MPAVAAGNSTLAMGAPVARLFFEPQNTMAIWSGREKPSRRDPQPVAHSTKARNTPSTTTMATRAGTDNWLHNPWDTASEKAP